MAKKENKRDKTVEVKDSLLQKKEIIYLPVDDLLYDPDNPRLPHSVIDSKKETEVINWMLQDASILELMGSIGLKDFFPAEPLLVVKHPEKRDKYYVVEGNRRLTAVKLLHQPKLAQKRAKAVQELADEAIVKPTSIPVLKYDSRKEILDYLGFKHITGVKPWAALAKAKYLQQLQPEYAKLPATEQYKSLAKAIGSRADYVRDLLSTATLYDKMAEYDFFNIPDLQEDTIDFGVYYNALKYAGISKYIGVDFSLKDPTSKVDIKKLEELANWISREDGNRETRLGESRNLGKLNKVVENNRALQLFKSGRKLDDAVMYTDEPKELVSNAINESYAQLQFANSNSHLASGPFDAEINTLDEIAQISERLKSYFQTKKPAKKK